jgi:hypothetical protein
MGHQRFISIILAPMWCIEFFRDGLFGWISADQGDRQTLVGHELNCCLGPIAALADRLNSRTSVCDFTEEASACNLIDIRRSIYEE